MSVQSDTRTDIESALREITRVGVVVAIVFISATPHNKGAKQQSNDANILVGGGVGREVRNACAEEIKCG